MANWKKLAIGAAGAGGDVINVEDVFSIDNIYGTGTTNNIVNGIDLAGEGGAVWGKSRDLQDDHLMFDTERGAGKLLRPNRNDVLEQTLTTTGITSFNSNGFTCGGGAIGFNSTGYDSIAWTFRKCPGFFDCVTYTGNGSAGRSISHNLGTTVGMLIIKRRNNQGGWHVWHRSEPTKAFRLDTYAEGSTSNAPYYFGNNSSVVAPTSTAFTVGGNSEVNNNGDTYVAYLFAHNNGDGTFGATGDQDVIKCGSFTTDSGGAVNTINLGFEPSFVMIKPDNGASSNADNWHIMDNIRDTTSTGTVGFSYKRLKADQNDPESYSGTGRNLEATGFQTIEIRNGQKYIYIAIRRGPMAVPETRDSVFEVAPRSSTSGYDYAFVSDFPVDMGLARNVIGSTEFRLGMRLMGSTYYMQTNSTNTKTYSIDWLGSDSNNSASFGFGKSNESPIEKYAWMWRKAPQFFDCGVYRGNGGNTAQTVNHGLTVAPEMLFVKNIDTQVGYYYNWTGYHKDLGDTSYGAEDTYIRLDSTNGQSTNSNFWNNTAPTSTQFSVRTATTNTTNDGYLYMAFATLSGISKVGSYVGNGGSQTISCGFSNGAKFILIKRYDSAANWYLWDTERGIVSGNDPYLVLNATDAQNSSYDSIDPASSGFVVNQTAGSNINVSSAKYIFYAVAV